MYPLIWEYSTWALSACLVSNAHVWTAPSIWRKLLMHAFICAVVRAFTKLGIAMVASNPMIATTIIISTSVKPALGDVRFFIVPFICRGVNQAAGCYY